MANRWFVLKLIFWIALVLFVVLYPMLISIYVFLPLFVGFTGWMLIQGFDGRGWTYVIVPLVYLTNLEINLSLPLMMAFFSILLYYLSLYKHVLLFKRCKLCVALMSVLLIDIYYVGSLMVYDLLMDTSSIVFDKFLWYSLLADIIMVVL